MKIKITLKTGDSCDFNIVSCYYEPKLKHLSFMEKETEKVRTISMAVIERIYVYE